MSKQGFSKIKLRCNDCIKQVTSRCCIGTNGKQCCALVGSRGDIPGNGKSNFESFPFLEKVMGNIEAHTNTPEKEVVTKSNITTGEGNC